MAIPFVACNVRQSHIRTIRADAVMLIVLRLRWRRHCSRLATLYLKLKVQLLLLLLLEHHA
jgi:hypothetical protein